MTRKREIEQAEAYALQQMRALRRGWQDSRLCAIDSDAWLRESEDRLHRILNSLRSPVATPTPAEAASLIRNFEDAVVDCVRSEKGSAAYTVTKWALEDALRFPVEQQPTRWLLQPTNNKERVRRTAPDEVEMIFYASRGWIVTPLYAVQQPDGTS